MVKKINKSLKRHDKRFSTQFGEKFYNKVQNNALVYIEGLIPNIPYNKPSSYQKIILVKEQQVAKIRVMEKQGRESRCYARSAAKLNLPG